ARAPGERPTGVGSPTWKKRSSLMVSAQARGGAGDDQRGPGDGGQAAAGGEPAGGHGPDPRPGDPRARVLHRHDVVAFAAALAGDASVVRGRLAVRRLLGVSERDRVARRHQDAARQAALEHAGHLRPRYGLVLAFVLGERLVTGVVRNLE